MEWQGCVLIVYTNHIVSDLMECSCQSQPIRSADTSDENALSSKACCAPEVLSQALPMSKRAGGVVDEEAADREGEEAHSKHCDNQ